MDYAGPAGLALQVIGGLSAGASANRQAGRQARAIEENGRRTVLQGELDASQVRRDERAATGEMIVDQAGSGFAMGTGSLADMIAQNAYHREVDVLNVRRKAAGDANALYGEAAEVRTAGKNALVGSVFGAVGTALGGVAQLRRDRLAGQSAAAVRASQRGGALGGGDIVIGPSVRVPRMSVLKY